MREKLIKEMRQIARGRGGRCLSSAYINTQTKLLWQCSEDHQWQATPNSVKMGSWCPFCAVNRRRKKRKSSK